jgi:glycosyltransferase involved in cell wall biosynthesis
VSTPNTFAPMPDLSPLERVRPGAASPLQRKTATAPARGPMPHICFLAPTTWPILAGERSIPVVGGAELQQTVLATALARRGYRVSMICIDYGQQDGAIVDGVAVSNMHKPDEGIPVVRFLHPRLTSLWGAMKRVDADVYYQRTAAAYTGFLAAFCRRYNRGSIYAGASDVDFLPGKQEISLRRDRALFEYGLRNVDRIIVQNPVQQQRVREHYGRDARLIQNCLRAPEGARADRDGYILWVASLRPQKRPEVLLEMARGLPQHRFIMIGGPDQDRKSEEYYRGIREAAHALPNVEVKGFVPFAEADRYFDGARLVLNTSAYEGFPNTFLQAWSRGVPTLAFVDTGSRRDGELVYDRVADVPEAVSRTDRLMRDDEYWMAASRRVRSFFDEHHSVDAIVKHYEQEIASLARAR